MERSPPWKATAPRRVAPAAGSDAAALYGYDRLLQRSAMLAMAAAMGTMLLGLPLHLHALGGGLAHAAVGPFAWLSAALASVAVAASLPALRQNHVPWSLGYGEPAVVLCCAAAAFTAGWAGLAWGAHGLLYFDVAAMSVAALAEGRALAVDGQRRSLAAAEQLALLTGAQCPVPPAVSRRSVAWPLATLLVLAATVVAARAAQTSTAGQALVAGLATAAACCPCALGRARASALAAARELAQRDGWIVASAEALATAEPWRAAIGLPYADRERLAALGRAARRAATVNVVWSVLLPALLLPLALRAPVDPLLPAAAMVIAWAAIGLTNRLLIGAGTVA